MGRTQPARWNGRRDHGQGKDFAAASAAVAKRDGEADFEFHCFDYVVKLAEPYTARMKRLREYHSVAASERLVKVFPVQVDTGDELFKYEEKCVAEGYEGVMIRRNGRYKCGRSTESDGLLLKLKRFEDAEAEVVECNERSDAPGELGAFTVRMNGVTFGLTYTPTNRAEAWHDRGKLIGRLVKFRHKLSGAGKAPRFPVFIGWREGFDLSPVR